MEKKSGGEARQDMMRRRPLMESKAVVGQKTFGGQRGMFREWIDKMRNAITGLSPELRAVLEWAEDTCNKIGEEKCNTTTWHEHRADTTRKFD